MTDDLRDLLARAGRDEASTARSEDFHGAFGDAVRGRVRRRRAVRATGVGSVAAVSVGALAFGAARLPGVADAGPGVAPGSRECGAGAVEVVAADLYGRYSPIPNAKPTAHGIDISTVRTRETWVIYDEVADHPAAEFAVMTDGTLEVVETNGRTYGVAPNEHGRYVFEAPGGGWVSFEAGSGVAFDWSVDQPDFVSATAAPTEPGTGVLCVPEDQTVPEPDASASALPSPAPSPSLSADPAAASSPYQCGFELPEESRLPEEWAIVDQEWLEADEAVRQLTDLYGDPSAVYTGQFNQPVLRVEADGTLLSHAGPGELGGFEPGGPASQLRTWGESFESASIAIVAVDDGEVVGRTPDSPSLVNGWFVDGDGSGTAKFGFMTRVDSIEPCADEELDGFALYAITAAATVDAAGTVTGPIYGWQEIENP